MRCFGLLTERKLSIQFHANCLWQRSIGVRAVRCWWKAAPNTTLIIVAFENRWIAAVFLDKEDC